MSSPRATSGRNGRTTSRFLADTLKIRKKQESNGKNLLTARHIGSHTINLVLSLDFLQGKEEGSQMLEDLVCAANKVVGIKQVTKEARMGGFCGLMW